MGDFRNEEENLDEIQRELERARADDTEFVKLTWMDDVMQNLKQAMYWIGIGELARASKHIVDANDMMWNAGANRFWCEDCWEKNYGEGEAADA